MQCVPFHINQIILYILQEENPSYNLADVNVQPMPKHERFSDTTVLQYLTSFYLVFALGFIMV